MAYISDLPMDNEFDIINSLNYDGADLLIIRDNGKYSHSRGYYLMFYDNGYANSWVLIPMYDKDYQMLLETGFKKEDILKVISKREGARTYNSVGFINKESEFERKQI